MAKSRTSKWGAIVACALLILAMGVFGYIYANNYLNGKELKISFYTLKKVETTAKVGSRGYYVDLDISFISDDKKVSKRLASSEQRLRDIVVQSLAKTNVDIRTPQGKKFSQREILKKVRKIAPEVYDVAFTNFLMVPLFGVDGLALTKAGG